MKLYRAFATVGGLTMVSRVLGFARDILIAAVLGTGAVADAFFVAFRFPNLFRRLFGEGAFNSAFVPLFAKRLEGEGPQAARSFAEEALAGLLFVLLLLTALAEIAMPWLMYALAPGFSGTPEKFDLAVLLTRIAFPYLLCMSLVALLSGALNALGRFSMAAAAPILLNVVLITAMLLAAGLGLNNTPQSGIVLAWGVAVAGVVQLAALWIAARRAGLHFRLKAPSLSADMKHLVRLGVPGLVSGGVTQLNIVVGTIIASLQAGAVSYLYYADRLYQLPLGIVGVAIGVVLLPDLARNLRAGNHHSVMDNQNRSVEFALMLTLPAAVVLAVAAEPIIRVLFERGAFKVSDTLPTACCACCLRLRPAGFRADQGVPARLLRPRGYPHAHALCGLEHGSQRRRLHCPVLPVSRAGPDAARRHRHRHHAVGVGQRLPAVVGPREPGPLRGRRSPAPQSAHDRPRQSHHGSGGLVAGRAASLPRIFCLRSALLVRRARSLLC